MYIRGIVDVYKMHACSDVCGIHIGVRRRGSGSMLPQGKFEF